MKRLLVVISAILLSPSLALAAIAYDTSVVCGSSGSWTLQGNTAVCSLTTGAVNSTYIVIPFIEGNSVNHITGVTVNGTSATSVYSISAVSGIGGAYGYGFVPTTTVNNVRVAQSTNDNVYGGLASYTGVGSLDAAHSAASTTAGINQTFFGYKVTPANANSMIVLSAQNGNASTFTAGSNTTVREQDTAGADFIADSGTPVTGQTEISVTAASGKWGGGAFVLAPPAAATTARPSGKLILFGDW